MKSPGGPTTWSQGRSSRSCKLLFCLELVGWEAGIRTPIPWSRDRCWDSGPLRSATVSSGFLDRLSGLLRSISGGSRAVRLFVSHLVGTVRKSRLRHARRSAVHRDPHRLERKICLKPYRRSDPNAQLPRTRRASRPSDRGDIGGHILPWWPVLVSRSRWTPPPKWPVLGLIRGVARGLVQRCPPLSDIASNFLPTPSRRPA